MATKCYKVVIKSESPFTKSINGTDVTIPPGVVSIYIKDDGDPKTRGLYCKDDLDKATLAMCLIRDIYDGSYLKMFEYWSIVNEYFLDFIKANINEIMEIHFEHNGKRLLINKFTKTAMENYLLDARAGILKKAQY